MQQTLVKGSSVQGNSSGNQLKDAPVREDESLGNDSDEVCAGDNVQSPQIVRHGQGDIAFTAFLA
jgi:hypothetical protein